MFFFVKLTSLSMVISRLICAAADGIISLFLWLNNIPAHTTYSIVYIHSPAWRIPWTEEALDFSVLAASATLALLGTS